jgi:DNA helicase-2/ATP-dependent DNA helicase PcrA
MVDSVFQSQIYKFIKEDTRSALISAVAGSGKSTTIKKALDYIPQHKDIILTAFSSDIAKHLKTQVSPHIEVKTLHSLGLSSLSRGKQVNLNKAKVYEIVKEKCKKWKTPAKQQKGLIYRLEKIVNFLRLTLTDEHGFEDMCAKYDILCSEEEKVYAFEVLQTSNAMISSIDFTDMIYQPIFRGIKLPKYDYIFVDEAQDLNRCQQQILLKMTKPTTRIIAVGDPNQAIFGFAGSDIDSFNRLKDLPNMVQLPLSICYRCDKAIVNTASVIVPEIKADVNRNDGHVRNGSVNEIKMGDWVLCRNTKPLVALCIFLLKKRIKANVKGNEFGNDIINLLNSLDTQNKVVACIKLDHQLEKLHKKLESYGIESPAKVSSFASLYERIEIIKDVIFPEVPDVSAAIKMVSQIFNENTHEVTLSTIHRAKGFESDRVFLIRRDLMPSKYATQPWQLVQEKNLEYVMITRAKHSLITVTDWTDLKKEKLEKEKRDVTEPDFYEN